MLAAHDILQVDSATENALLLLNSNHCSMYYRQRQTLRNNTMAMHCCFHD